MLLDMAQKITAEDVRINQMLGTHGAALLPDVACVMTHCNAGALATAGHGTALGVVRSAAYAGNKIEVIANETRPFLQGARGIGSTTLRGPFAASLVGRWSPSGRVEVPERP
jgi:methylthioribose-1-phosphate isomerase